MLEKINFGNGVLSKHFGSKIYLNISLESQIDALTEDILQVNYSNSYCIDVGWYPEFNIKGHFLVLIIFSDDWENPIKKITCNKIDDLLPAITECIDIIQDLIKTI